MPETIVLDQESDKTVDQGSKGSGNQGSPDAPGADKGSAITDLPAAQAEIARVRQEAAASRIELKKLQDADKARVDAALSEEQRRQQALDAANVAIAAKDRRIQELELLGKVNGLAVKHRIEDPELVHQLLINDKTLEWKDGEAQDIEKHVEAILKAHPRLQGNAPGSGGAGRIAGAGSAPGGRIYTAAEMADPKFFRENKDDIWLAFREGRTPQT